MPCWHLALYDDFAWFYDRYWNQDFHAFAFPIVERLLLPDVPPKGRVLDVCCGTGYLAGLLAARGYRVTGVDESAEMIAHARRNVPAASFQVANAARFRVRGKCDAAVSTFDSLNHILDPAELGLAMQRTAAALKPGAPFLFDMLLESAYQTDWADRFTLVRDDHVLLITGAGFDFRTRLAECRITTFRLIEGTWRRADILVRERCYASAEIEEALDAAGFDVPAWYDARDLGMDGQLGQGRTFILARLKA
jgi:SAM-dependent methyltransferase